MIALKVVLICALVLLVISPAFGQQTMALGLAPGSMAYASGHEGPNLYSADMMDFAAESGVAAESGALASGYLGLAPRSENLDSCKLGMAGGFKTKSERMESASDEATLLEKLGYSPFEVPKSEVPKSEKIKLVPEKIAPEKASEAGAEAEMLSAGGEGRVAERNMAYRAEMPASGGEAARMIIEPAPKPKKSKSGDDFLDWNSGRLERLGLINYYHNMEVLEHGGRNL